MNYKSPGRIRGFFLIVAAVAVYAAFAVLAVLPAPTYVFWKISILASEWGYWFAIPGLIVAAFTMRRARTFSIITLIAAVLLLTPLFRAQGYSAKTLLTGTNTKPITPKTYEYKPGLKLDYYQGLTDLTDPKDPKDLTVLIIHGGSWRGGDQKQLPKLNYHLARLGYNVAAITYRLSPQHKFPAAVEDARAAIEFLKTRMGAKEIVVLGRSAGGQLALITAYTTNDPAIKGAISFYGSTNMLWGWNNPGNPLVIDSRDILRDYIGGSPSEKPDAYRLSSAVNYIRDAKPTLLIHGAKDELVSVYHSRSLAGQLRSLRKGVVYLEMPWATHGCDYAFNGPCGQVSTWAVEEFLFELR